MTYLTRHPSVNDVLAWFDFAHLPDHLQKVSRPIGDLAHTLVLGLPDSPELTNALRKLLEAKDSFVRAALAAYKAAEAEL